MCGSGVLTHLGALPDMARFAGAALSESLSGGRLYSCEHCNSMQRSPILPTQLYSELYEAGSDEVWTGEVHRPDHERVAAFILRRKPPISVLDIGCNTGRFLRMLPDSVRKFGVEPSIQSALIARNAGVEILAGDVEGVSSDMRFDCITLIDVLEHVPEPRRLLETLLAMLNPGGRLVISTGDPECPAWRNKHKNKFWYCSFAEHISFPSLKWLESVATNSGFSLEHAEQFRYGDFGAARTFVKWMFQTTYRFFPPLSYLSGWVLMRERLNPFARVNLFLPCAGVYRDHHIVSLLASESV
jgi:2-polyprenyl-3-methyl-5-hydroxy-6-metoxy-1,4-benzoquinol methylase